MNKLLIFIVIVLAVIIVVLTVFLFLPTQKVKAPTAAPLTGIEIFSPKANEVISSPLKIIGSISGNGWDSFEGYVGTVSLKDSNSKELIPDTEQPKILTAKSDWTKLPVNFEYSLEFVPPKNGTGVLVFYNDNPSGDPERDKTFILPVRFK